MGRTREVSKILSSNTLLATDAELASVQSSLGLIHINTTTFTSVSTQQVTGCFTSTYKNYFVVFNIDSSTGNSYAGLRFGTNGTPNTNSSYISNLASAQWAGAIFSNDNRGTQNFGTLNFSTSVYAHTTFYVTNPKSSTLKTTWQALGVRGDGFGTTASGEFNATTAFDDLIVLHGNANMTGSISVFGVKG